MKLSSEIIRQVEDCVLETYLRAQQLYSRTFELPEIVYDLRGEYAGRAFFFENRIRLNPILLAENRERFIARTVPHEIAHLINNALNGVRVKPHGKEWQSVMRDLGLPSTRCHSYDTSNARVKSFYMQQRHPYSCGCTSFSISQTRHNRIQAGSTYSCRRCKAPLRPTRVPMTAAA